MGHQNRVFTQNRLSNQNDAFHSNHPLFVKRCWWIINYPPPTQSPLTNQEVWHSETPCRSIARRHWVASAATFSRLHPWGSWVKDPLQSFLAVWTAADNFRRTKRPVMGYFFFFQILWTFMPCGNYSIIEAKNVVNIPETKQFMNEFAVWCYISLYAVIWCYFVLSHTRKIFVSQPLTPVNGQDERQAAIDRGWRLRFVRYQGVSAAGWLSPV